MPNIDTKQLRRVDRVDQSPMSSASQLYLPHSSFSSNSSSQHQNTSTSDMWELGEVGESEIFGELSFLGQPLLADFVASEDTEVFVLDQQMLSLLYVKDQSLEGRFYRYLATQLQQALHKVSSVKLD